MNLFERWRSVGSAEGARPSRAAATLGVRSAFSGDIVGPGDLRVAGKLEGAVRVGGLLEIVAGGSVEPEVEAGEMRVAGGAAGRIRVHGVLAAEAGGHISGEMTAGRWTIDEGAVVDGTINRSTPTSAN
jgi:cytoskeletal protein CcmA (bactofilin family)